AAEVEHEVVGTQKALEVAVVQLPAVDAPTLPEVRVVELRKLVLERHRRKLGTELEVVVALVEALERGQRRARVEEDVSAAAAHHAASGIAPERQAFKDH